VTGEGDEVDCITFLATVRLEPVPEQMGHREEGRGGEGRGVFSRGRGVPMICYL
jgi:hypothetical protein